MKNKNRIIELLTTVRYTTNDIEKVADEICSLFSVVGQSEQLVCGESKLDCPYDFTSRCTMGRCDCKPKAN